VSLSGDLVCHSLVAWTALAVALRNKVPCYLSRTGSAGAREILGYGRDTDITAAFAKCRLISVLSMARPKGLR